MIVSRILHAGYVFESAGVRIAFDPVFETPFSTNCFPFPACSFSLDGADLKFDAVFISHFHDDHCSLVSLARLPRSVPLYLYCVHTELFEMIRSLGFTVYALAVDEPVFVDGFTVTPRLALDADIDAVYQIEAEGLAVLNVVDAWIDPSVLSLRSSWDLVLWPFQTMRELAVLSPNSNSVFNSDSNPNSNSNSLPPEWVEQLTALRPRHVIPSSCQIKFEDWSWYNSTYFPITYAQFAREIPLAQRMEPGETFELTSRSLEKVGRLDWIKPIGDQKVDYEFSNATPPPTSDIARRFPALSAEQRLVVDKFCEGLDVTLYDHEGVASGSGTTEAIAYKVYRAIEHGEQITSMYLRTDDIENDELIARLSHDPLAFQRAQLHRL